MKYKNLSLKDAADEVIMKKLVDTGGGGIISVDKAGNVAMPFNTPGMYRGFIQSNQKPRVLIYKNE